MPGRTALTQYRKRLNALVGQGQAVDKLLNQYGSMPDYDAATGTGLPRRDTVLALLNRFKAFTQPHFDFFFDGFTSNGPVKLFESTVLPPSAVLGTILFQLTEDLELIQRAAGQRLSPQFRPTLERADKLAWKAVQQADAMFPATKPTTVLTYFHKTHQVRVVPYAPVALVGIPLTCTFEERDFLAIPHEVGHYVYHHRDMDPFTSPVNRSYARLRTRQAPADGIQTDWAHWQEEIFADVFGALVAGPVMAFDFQELMREYARFPFVDLSDEHPTPALRPLIYTYVLGKANALQALVAKLDEDWREILEDRWSKTYANRGEEVLNQTRGPLEKQAWSALLGTSLNASEATIQAGMSLARLAAMREQDTVQGTEWDGETENYVARIYNVMRLLNVNGDKVQLIAPLRDLIDKAQSLMTFTPSSWSGTPQEMLQALVNTGEGDKPFKDGLDNLIENVVVSDLGTAAPADLWQEWIRGQKFFGGDLPEELATAAGGTFEIAKGAFEDVVLNKPIPTSHVPKQYSWVPVWYAGGWTSEPPRVSPPGG